MQTKETTEFYKTFKVGDYVHASFSSRVGVIQSFTPVFADHTDALYHNCAIGSELVPRVSMLILTKRSGALIKRPKTVDTTTGRWLRKVDDTFFDKQITALEDQIKEIQNTREKLLNP